VSVLNGKNGLANPSRLLESDHTRPNEQATNSSPRCWRGSTWHPSCNLEASLPFCRMRPNRNLNGWFMDRATSVTTSWSPCAPRGASHPRCAAAV